MLDEEALLAKAFSAYNGAKFARLWQGNWTGYPSQSEADLALVCLLWYWTRGCERQVDRLFRRSGLLREKWRKRDDYRRRTLERARQMVQAGYDLDEATQTSVSADVRRRVEAAIEQRLGATPRQAKVRQHWVQRLTALWEEVYRCTHAGQHDWILTYEQLASVAGCSVRQIPRLLKVMHRGPEPLLRCHSTKRRSGPGHVNRFLINWAALPAAIPDTKTRAETLERKGSRDALCCSDSGRPAAANRAMDPAPWPDKL